MARPAPLLLHVFSSFEVGGAQIRFVTLANRFGARFRHALIAMDGCTDARDRLDPDIAVEFPAIVIRKGDTAGNLLRFRRLLAALRPDALVTSGWGTIEWAMANTPKLVRHLHLEDGFGAEEVARQLRRRVLLRRLFLRRSTVVLPSRTLCRVATEIWRLDPAQVRHIPNGVDLARFGLPPAARRPEPVIGTVAGLRPEKNVARLIRAFARVAAVTPARLVIAGEGSERARLAALAAELGLADRVDFAGQLARPELLYRELDVFALASDTEQMPLSVLEAMAAGLPVASTDVGDVRWMLAAENHDFVTERDAAALATALLRLLADPALRRRLGEANRAKAARDYDQAVMLAAYAALIDPAPVLAEATTPRRHEETRRHAV